MPGPGVHERFERAESVLGHEFSDPALLERALTHPSYSSEPNCQCDYERLEFLGDAVLGLVIVDHIYNTFAEMPEGVMTKLKIAVVSGSTLSRVADDLGLGELLLLGRSEQGTGGRGMTSALENVFEALVGALYLDGGLEVARHFIISTLGHLILPDYAESIEHPKSRLQEHVQAEGDIPEYTIAHVHGPPHARRFTAEVRVGDQLLGTGEGKSKKEAEMAAAAQAMETLLGMHGSDVARS